MCLGPTVAAWTDLVSVPIWMVPLVGIVKDFNSFRFSGRTSVLIVEIDCNRCQTEPDRIGISLEGVAHDDVHRGPMPSLSFLLDYRNRVWLPEVKELIIKMSLNASGVRDTADRHFRATRPCGSIGIVSLCLCEPDHMRSVIILTVACQQRAYLSMQQQ